MTRRRQKSHQPTFLSKLLYALSELFKFTFIVIILDSRIHKRHSIWWKSDKQRTMSSCEDQPRTLRRPTRHCSVLGRALTACPGMTEDNVEFDLTLFGYSWQTGLWKAYMGPIRKFISLRVQQRVRQEITYVKGREHMDKYPRQRFHWRARVRSSIQCTQRLTKQPGRDEKKLFFALLLLCRSTLRAARAQERVCRSWPHARQEWLRFQPWQVEGVWKGWGRGSMPAFVVYDSMRTDHPSSWLLDCYQEALVIHMYTAQGHIGQVAVPVSALRDRFK